MKKLLREGNTGCRTGTGKISFLLLFFVLSFDVFPQVPINGFCKYQEFNINPGFDNLFPLNYNGDSYTDLLLFNPSGKKICALDGFQNSSFGQSHLHEIRQQFSSIQYLRDTNQNITGYAFISRKQSSAGIMKINQEGKPEIESLIKFNTYPENISVADINGDGKPELLISGGAFDGLSIVYNDKKLIEKKIADKTNYPEAVFADLDHDNYTDVAAFEIFTRTLQFFYNNSKGDFSKVREIHLNNPINQLQAADLDFDSYSDLIFSSGNGINIFYGDFASAYADTLNIPAKFRVDKFITGDFNKDGKIDIAYLNIEEGVLSLIFAKDNRTFYPELIYFKKDSLNDIAPYYSKFVDGISLLGNNGKLYLVSELTSFSDSVSIASGGYPTALSYFDKDNNGITDLCFIDGFTTSLNLITRNISGIPETWFPVPMFGNESVILVDNKNPQDKIFYCFTEDKKLIEILNVDLKKNTYTRNSIYTAGMIKDVELNSGYDKIYTAFLEDGRLGVTVFSKFGNKYSGYSLKDIRSNVINASLSVSGSPVVFYAADEMDSIYLGWKFLEDNKKSSEIKTGLKNTYDVFLHAVNFPVKSNPALYGILTSDIKNLIVYLNRSSFIISAENGNRIKVKNPLFFGETRSEGLRKVYFYNDAMHTINSLDISAVNRKISSDIITVDIDARTLFIKNMNSQKYHIVYIDKTENCINIKELK